MRTSVIFYNIVGINNYNICSDIMWRFSWAPIATGPRQRSRRWVRLAPARRRSGPGPVGWARRSRCSCNWWCPVSWSVAEQTERRLRHRLRQCLRHSRPTPATSACWTTRLGRCGRGLFSRCPRPPSMVRRTSLRCSAPVSNRPVVSSLHVRTHGKKKTRKRHQYVTIRRRG